MSHRACCHTCYTIQLMHYSLSNTFTSTELSSQADHKQTRTPNTHRWHTHAATYCVITQTQRTKISGRNSNGTKHSGGPPEDVREKRPKHVGVLYLQTRFQHFIGFKCWNECVLKWIVHELDCITTNITVINTNTKVQVKSTRNTLYTHKHIKQWVDIL